MIVNDLKKVVLVTGASSGIGESIVKLLSKNNFQIIASMRDIDGKNRLKAKELKNFSDNIDVEDLDVTDNNSVKTTVNNILEKFNNIDVVINNAGIMNVGLAEGFSINQLEKQMAVNYIGVAGIFKEFLPNMKKRKEGLFITISSIAGRIVFPFLSTYNPSKFAVEALAEIYRYELYQFNIDSIIIEPGPFETNLIKNSPRPQDLESIKDYGNLINAAEETMQHFQQFMKDNPDCNPNLISKIVLKLINTEYGKRPLRTTCGIEYGVKELNDIVEKYQLEILKKMNMEFLIPRPKG